MIHEGNANLFGTAALAPRPKLIEAVSETRIDGFTLDVIAGQGEGTTVYGRLYEDGLGAIRARWGAVAAPQVPEGGTAVDLSTGSLQAAIRQNVGGFRSGKVVEASEETGIEYVTDGLDGAFEVNWGGQDTDLLQATRLYTWEAVFQVGSTVHRIALGEFRVVEPPQDQIPFDKGLEGLRKFGRAGAFSFIGEAIVGSTTSAPVWRIRRVVEDLVKGSLVQFADGDREFDNVWDDRLVLAYS